MNEKTNVPLAHQYCGSGIQKFASAYHTPEYLSPKRLSSVGWQLRLLVETHCKEVLIIGKGSGILDYMLEKNNIRVLSVDIDVLQHPTVVGALPRLPFADSSFECVAIFQVLEHIPYDLLIQCLSELRRICFGTVLLSLPDHVGQQMDQRPSTRALACLLGAKTDLFSNSYRLSVRNTWVDKEHLWEIGARGHTLDEVLQDMLRGGWDLDSQFANPRHRYHRFFVLRAAEEAP